MCSGDDERRCIRLVCGALEIARLARAGRQHPVLSAKGPVMVSIRAASADDAPHIHALHDLCFGPGRFARTAYRLREANAPAPGLSLVAEETGGLVGSVEFWPVRIGASAALLLGPLAVDPRRRGAGIGIDLMARGLALAAEAGHGLVILVGDAPYYQRVGFHPVPPGQMTLPGPVDPRRLLACELIAGSLDAARGRIVAG